MPPTLSALLAAAVLAAPSPAPPAPPVVTVHAKEFAFVSPASIRAGATTFRLINDGKELHHLSIIRLAPGKTMADYMATLKPGAPPARWAVELGGPNASTPGGGVSEATVTLEPGSYLLACWIPSPGEQAPHIMKGMVHPLTVTAARGAAALTVTAAPGAAVEPKADVDIRLSDYKFTTPLSLAPGKHVFRVTNDAVQSHELFLVRLAPGKTPADVASWVETGQKGPPPAQPMGGTVGLGQGHSVTFPATLAPGSYGLLCFIPDMKDGRPHSAHGMMQQIQVAAK